MSETNTVNFQVVSDNIVNDMTPYLDYDQIEHLRNSLYINFHNKQIVSSSTELVAENTDSNEFKIRMFLSAKRSLNRSPRTLQQYDREIHKFVYFINKPIEDVTAMDIRYYISVLQERNHLAATTVHTRVQYLNSFYDFLLTEGIVTHNPVKQVGNIKVEKVIKTPFSTEELEALRENTTSLRDRALIEFLYSTGVRVSELVALNVGDINFAKQELIVLGKGNKQRKTYLTDSANYFLKKYLKSRIAEEDFMHRPLFVTLDAPHNRLTVQGVQYMLRELGKRARVENCHPHRFRRTIATDLLNKGMPVEQVKEFLGHEKIDTTMIYCTVTEEQVKFSHHKYA